MNSIAQPVTSSEAAEADYNYQRFTLRQYALDTFAGPRIGQQAVDFEAITLDGRTVKLSDFLGRVVVLETGSITCPQYVSRIRPMNRLSSKYPDVVFLLLYTREAHPGSSITEHHTLKEKHALAQRLTAAEPENRLILIDDLAGTVHQAYGGLPNMVYITAPDGTVAFRADWNNPDVVEQVIDRVRQGEEQVRDLRAGFRPVAPGVLLRVLKRAGWGALLDFVMALPGLIWQHLKVKMKGQKL